MRQLDYVAQASGSIPGGFVALSVADLAGAWAACVGGKPGAGGFRAWLGCWEMVSRRQAGAVGDRRPHYGFDELARLLGVSARVARAAVRRLVDAGLIRWADDGSEVGFNPPKRLTTLGAGEVVKPLSLGCRSPLDSTIGAGRGTLSIPRRLLRWLVRGARPAVIAVALGSLLRCVSRRRSGWTSRGRIKTSWVAAAFGIAERHARSARGELVRLGWLQPDPHDAGDQSAWNRWGRAFVVRLDWRAPRPDTDRPTQVAQSCAETSYPIVNPDSPSGISNPELAQGEPSGACAGTEEGEAGTSKPAEVAVVAVPRWDSKSRQFVVEDRVVDGQILGNAEQVTAPNPGHSGQYHFPKRTVASPDIPTSTPSGRPLPPPRLRDVKSGDLANTARLLTLLDQAVGQGWVTGSEADRIQFVAAAEHARSAGDRNAPGLLVKIIQNSLWRVIKLDDEDRARLRLRVHDRAERCVSMATAGRPARGPETAGASRHAPDQRGSFRGVPRTGQNQGS